MKALFIGRFQPFHNGHFKVVKSITEKYDTVIIGIGSSQYKNTKDNPFSADERKKMIEATLKNNDIRNYRIVLIPDIHNPPRWVDHVLSIVSDFDIVIANDDFTKKLFTDKNFKVEETQLYNRGEYAGEEIRKKILNNKSWEEFLPGEVTKIIQEIKGIERIKKFSILSS